MNSSLAAILASPVSGVSGAVTGYPVGRGDGVNTVFPAPPEITAISALYRRDWQGTVELSPNPRTNYVKQSQNMYAWTKSNTPTITPGAKTLGAASLDLVGDASAEAMANITSPTPFAAMVSTGVKKLSFLVSKGSSTRTLVIVYDTAPRVCGIINWVGDVPTIETTFTGVDDPTGTLTSVDDLGSGIYRMNFDSTSIAAGATPRLHVYPAYGSNAAVGDIYIGCFHFSDTPGAYIPTTTAPVTVTDYTASGTTLTLSEAPALAAELTVDGTGVDLPLLQIGG